MTAVTHRSQAAISRPVHPLVQASCFAAVIVRHRSRGVLVLTRLAGEEALIKGYCRLRCARTRARARSQPLRQGRQTPCLSPNIPLLCGRCNDRLQGSPGARLSFRFPTEQSLPSSVFRARGRQQQLNQSIECARVQSHQCFTVGFISSVP